MKTYIGYALALLITPLVSTHAASVGTFFNMTVAQNDVIRVHMVDEEPIHELYIGGYLFGDAALGWSIDELPVNERRYELHVDDLSLPNPDSSALQVVVPNKSRVMHIHDDVMTNIASVDSKVLKDTVNAVFSAEVVGPFVVLDFSFDDMNGLPEEYELAGFTFGYHGDIDYSISNSQFADAADFAASTASLAAMSGDKDDGAVYVAFGQSIQHDPIWLPTCQPGDEWDITARLVLGSGDNVLQATDHMMCPI